MKEYKISVIVPVYNVEKYLEECIESLINQSESFFEIILINDGSTDNSLKICKLYESRNKNIRVINHENVGLGATRNIGMRIATGEFIVFVDSDDYLRVDACEKISNSLDNTTEVLYYNASIQYDIASDESEDAFIHSKKADGKVWTGIDFFKLSYPRGFTSSACVAAYKKAFLEINNITFPEGIYYEDLFFTTQVITCAKFIKCIPEMLYVRRCRENSIMSSNLSEKKCLDLVKTQIEIWNYIKKRNTWITEISVLKKYVAADLVYRYLAIAECKNAEYAERKKIELITAFSECWLSLFLKTYENWSECIALLLVLQELKRYGLLARFEINNQKVIENVRLKLTQCLEQFFQKTYLSDNTKGVAIYGIGNHTIAFLRLYKELIGEVKCNLYFIVSMTPLEKEYKNCPIFTYQEITKEVSQVIISSWIYQEDMYSNLRSINYDEESIVQLYDRDTIFDVTILEKLFDELKG